MVRRHNANQERDKKKLIRVDKDEKKPDKIILREINYAYFLIQK